MEEQTILDMCQSHNVKVSIEYDRGWAEWIIEVSSRNTSTRNPIKHTYRYKNIDIEASGIGTYEYLRQRIALNIAKDF